MPFSYLYTNDLLSTKKAQKLTNNKKKNMENQELFSFDDVQQERSVMIPKDPYNVVKVKAIEFVEAKDESKPEATQTKVTFEEKDGDVVSEVAINFLNPFSGDVQYRKTNVGRYISLFNALAQGDLLETLKAKFAQGFKPDHKALQDECMAHLVPNWKDIECQLLIGYPVSKGTVSKYLGLPTVGSYISSTLKPTTLKRNSNYLALEAGAAGNGKAPDKTSGGNGQPKGLEADF